MKQKNIKTLILVLVLLLFLSSQSFAFFNHEGTGTYGADFLNIGVGAKATAMGNAYVALANDLSAIYWNPSGLVQLTRPQINFSHTRWLSDIYYEYVGLAIPLSSRSVAAGGIMYLHMGSTLGYDDQDESTSFFTAYDAVVVLAFSSYLFSNLSLGATLKGIQEKLENKTAQCLALDIGTCYQYRRLSLGLVVRNLGNSLRFNQKGSSLPAGFSAGAAVRTFDNLIMTTDIDFPASGGPALKQGVEYNLSGQMFLRTGYEYKDIGVEGQGSTTPTFGGGLRISDFEFDYAFSRYKLMGDIHTFSFVYRFGEI